jgi:hypothetical protein
MQPDTPRGRPAEATSADEQRTGGYVTSTVLERAKRYEWLPILRRVRCKPSVKLVGFVAASYGNADGGSIFPGIARLSNVTGLDDTTVKLSLKTLRTLGLMERVFEGSSRGRGGGMSDEHVLTLPVGDPSSLPLLPLDESDPEREAKREAKRAADTERKRRSAGKNRLSQTRNRLSETSERVVSITGNRLSDTTPPRDVPRHVVVDEGQHSARNRAASRPGATARETFDDFAARHRKLMVRDGEVLTDEDEEFVSSTIRGDYVRHTIGDLDDVEERTVDGMLSNGVHPKTIVNAIAKTRRDGTWP